MTNWNEIKALQNTASLEDAAEKAALAARVAWATSYGEQTV